MKKFNPKFNKPSSYLWYSWLQSVCTQTYVVSVQRLTSQRLTNQTRQPLIKWARRSVKKKRGQLAIYSQLHHHLYRKPIGVRMGSGKGKLTQKYLLTRKGQPLLVFKNIQKQKAELVKKFFKKSQLQLQFFQQKC